MKNHPHTWRVFFFFDLQIFEEVLLHVAGWYGVIGSWTQTYWVIKAWRGSFPFPEDNGKVWLTKHRFRMALLRWILHSRRKQTFSWTVQKRQSQAATVDEKVSKAFFITTRPFEDDGDDFNKLSIYSKVLKHSSFDLHTFFVADDVVAFMSNK